MNSQAHQRVGIIGHSIAHTLSPAMHTAAFDKLCLPFRYGVFDVADEFLWALLAALRKNGFAGANVTIPYKERIIPLLDDVNEDAEAVGAVNTIVNHDGTLTGYNTDVAGIQQALAPFKERIRNVSVVVLGAGGGARVSTAQSSSARVRRAASVAVRAQSATRSPTRARSLARRIVRSASP